MINKKEKTFLIQVTMKDRWIPHFFGMLKTMERYGNIGRSRSVGIYADGDGDFHPKFHWLKSLPNEAKPETDNNGNVLFDAG